MDMCAHIGKAQLARDRFGSAWPLPNRLRCAPYVKTIDFPGTEISYFHRELRDAYLGRCGVPFNIDIGIDGYLQRGDAMKLYELSYFAPGDVIELGTHFGLSASIIAHALQDRGFGGLHSVDIDSETTARARHNIAGRPGADRVRFVLEDAGTYLAHRAAKRERAGFIFIDHWHGYDATVAAAKHCADILEPGGFVQFHDFVNAENAETGNDAYGVYQAVLDVIVPDDRFCFRGISGCTAIFQFED